MSTPSRVLVLTRSGCHLCVEAVATVRRNCEELGVAWQSKDVDSDPQLKARFTDHVPVTFVDQSLLSYWFLDEEALNAALKTGAPRPMNEDWILAQPPTKA